MKNLNLLNALDKAMAETAEQLFFQELSEMHKENVNDVFGNGDFLVEVNIVEPFKARLYFLYEQKFAEQMVTEMLGEVIDSHKQLIDGLKELSNTIAGKFMANYIQDQQFRIGLPNFKSFSGKTKLPFEQICNYYFDETKIGVALQPE